MPNFNRANISETPVCFAINRLIEEAEANNAEGNNRQYLGASSIGSECMRKIQYDWMCDASHPLRIRDIFRRGHLFEALTKQHLIAAGFVFEPSARALGFKTAGGLFRGHCDGIITGGPDIPGIGYPCLWEHKALGAKGWRAIERHGVAKEYPHYAAQVLIYQAYLNLTDHPAIFTVTNADTLERVHEALPFDAARAQEWSDRPVAVIEATRAGELLPRVSDDREDWHCRMCGFIRLLASDRDGEVIGAVRAIQRILEAAGADFNALAGRLFADLFTEEQAREIYFRGFKDGQRQAEKVAAPTFQSVDGPTWHEIACACAAHPQRLKSENEKTFVEDMVRRLVHGGEPTEKQKSWLRKIYARR